MKRITLLSIAIFLLASFTKAQITKGSTFIGGQLSAGESKTENAMYPQKMTYYTISPALGTAIKQNLIAGIDLTYGHSKNEYSNTSHKGNAYGGGFYLRRYVPIVNRFYFFIQGRAGYSYGKDENHDGSGYHSTNENSAAGLSLYPGVTFRLSRVLYIETGFNSLAVLYYSHSKYTQTNSTDQTSNNFGFSTSVSGTDLSFGLRFIIPKK